MVKNINYDSLGYYKILKADNHSSDDEIRQNYRELAKFWHPDHNTAPNAVDVFQQLSVAYDVLKDPQTRLKYTLLSLIYPKEKFPEFNSLRILCNMHGQEDLNLRAFHLVEITGKGIGHSSIDKIYYCSQYEAAGVVASIAKHNWLKGFWGVSAFFANIQAIILNILRINNKKENFALLLHNSLAYKDEGRFNEAATLAALAQEYASAEENVFINQYLNSYEHESFLSVKKWNFKKLKSFQLFYPLIALLALIFLCGMFYVQNIKQDNLSVQLKKTITFRDGSKTFSDVAVAKIFDIPVDVYSKNELYNTVKTVDARHGADKDFDIFKTVEKGTTVRITGYTADKAWFRVMFDNGEMAFIEAKDLQQGIGKAIPLWSKIYKE